jgi:hypothetical protein
MEGLHDMLVALLQAVIVAAVPILTGFAVSFFKNKSAQIAVQIGNERAKQALEELSGAVSAAVAQTGQDYVDDLKKSGTFSAEAQIAALKRAKETALAALTPVAKNYLTENHDGLQRLLEAKIEEAVRARK